MTRDTSNNSEETGPKPHMPTEELCYVISYDHGGLVLWGYDHFVRHFRGLLEWLDRHPTLKMGIDNEAWMYDWIALNQPAVLHEIREALQRYRGRLGVGSCNYGQPLAFFLLEESNIRQIALGLSAVRERLGYEVSVYSWSEHAGFPQLPQILVGLGLDGVLMRTHYLMYGHCPGYDQPVVWWQAPDGSRIRCVPTYIHQERQVEGHRAHPPGPFGLTTEDTWILTRYPSKESPHPLDAFRRRFQHISPLAASRIDDSGLKREALVTELEGQPEYRWATLEDLFAGLPAPSQTVCPSAEDFGRRMPWGYRGNELFDLARRAEIAVLTAERLLAGASRPADGSKIPAADLALAEQEIEQAWKDLLAAQHHDVQIVARAGAFGRERLHASLERSAAITRTLLARFAAPGDPDEFVAFNPLPWRRAEPYAWLPDGAPLPGRVTAGPLGAAALRVPPLEERTPTGSSVDTGSYHVEFADQGGISSWTQSDGRPVLLAGSGRLAGVINGEPCESTGAMQVWETPGGYRAEERGLIGAMPYNIAWLLDRESSRVECRVNIRFNGERIGMPTDRRDDSRSCFTHEQKLRIRFYPALDAGSTFGLYDAPFGIARTDHPYVEGCLWTALADESGGLAVANRGTMGSCREPDGAFSVPLAFSESYVWGAEVVSGERSWDLALLPWRGGWESARIHRRALEFAFPILAIPGRHREGLPGRFEIKNPDVHLTAFYSSGGRGYLRLFNGSDHPQTVDLDLSEGARLVDLRHQETGPVGRPLRLAPWQFITIRAW